MIGCIAIAAFGLLVIVAFAVVAVATSSRQPSQTVTSVAGQPTPTQKPVIVPPTATAAPRPTALPKLGQGVTLSTPGGLRLVVTANEIADPSPSANQFNKPQGRWVVVDWTVRNDGQADQQVSASWLKIITESGYVVDGGNHAGHREPGFESGVLGPSQMRRGFLAYDTPAAQRVKAAIFQSPGNRQFVIAELPS